MTKIELDNAAPFFTVFLIENEAELFISGKSIILNLSEEPVSIKKQQLGHLQSVILQNTEVENVKNAVIVDGIDRYSDEAKLFEKVRDTWPSAFDVRGEERLRGIGHYMSPKVWIGQIGITFYHAATVPLNVGLHRFHEFCPVDGFREVHTQIIGFGKMQQCLERDIDTLYLEEPMAPGATHRPMYDEKGNYPWHQFETITPSIFMAIEMLPEGASPPKQ